jgi:hypothetical protein
LGEGAPPPPRRNPRDHHFAELYDLLSERAAELHGIGAVTCARV